MLDKLQIPGKKNKILYSNGSDNLQNSVNEEHWKNYPWKIIYEYNSRGFRDQEWPNNFDDVIWCVGDSFTAGIGAPVEHTWWYILSNTLQKRCINISMDGASNDWIARQVQYLLKHFPQGKFVIMWSYITRFEMSEKDVIDNRIKALYNLHKELFWPMCSSYDEFMTLPWKIQKKISKIVNIDEILNVTDEDRINGGPANEQCVERLFNRIDEVERAKMSSTIVHTFIPGFCYDEKWVIPVDQRMLGWPKDYLWLTEVQYFDKARDYLHFDIKSASKFVTRLTALNVL